MFHHSSLTPDRALQGPLTGPPRHPSRPSLKQTPNSKLRRPAKPNLLNPENRAR